MRRVMTLLLALVSMTALAQAARADDQAIDIVPCSPTVRTEIIGIVGEPTTITFPKTEKIYRIVQTGKLGKDDQLEDAGWQAPDAKEMEKLPLENNLPLWPAHTGMSTMSVITATADGNFTVYPFRLISITAEDAAKRDKKITLNLICSGKGARPAPPPTSPSAASPATPSTPSQVRPGAPAHLVAAMRPRTTPQQQAAAEAQLRADAFNGIAGGCFYHAKGKQPNAITPLCPMDNGEWTLMHFPGLSKQPAVYVVTGENDERLARQHASGDFVVVEEIAAHFRLRLGEDVLDILNDHYDPAGTPAGTGTIAPTVKRELLQAKQTIRQP
jgi:type IV secretory pathway VirB9-like protein